MDFKKTLTASELKRGMQYAVPNHFLKFLDRKLDSDYHYDTVDGIVESTDDNGNACLVVFGFNKVVKLPHSQFVYLIE